MDSEPPAETNTDPASALEVVEVEGGRQYRLPPRQVGAIRWAAVVPLGIAIGVSYLFVDFYITYTAKGPFDAIAWVMFLSFSFLWAGAAYILVTVAAITWCGRTQIEVSDGGAVRATDRAGIFRWRWAKLPPGMARQLAISELPTLENATEKPPPGLADLWILSAVTEYGARVWLAPGYPREVLAALANILAKQLALTAIPQENTEETNIATSIPPVTAPLPVIVETREPPSRDVLEQPLASLVDVERHPDGVTLTVPPLGIWRATGGMILMGLIFATVGGIVTVATLAPVLQANPKLPSGAILVGVVFLCIGIGVTVSSINVGRKKVVLAVVGNQLLTFETGPLGSRRREFARDTLLDIACGPSNISVNKQPLPQLQIVVQDKPPVGMLTGRDETELLWIATVLRQSLGIPSKPPKSR